MIDRESSSIPHRQDVGLHRSAHIGTASHMPWATAYEVVCGAGCPDTRL